MFTVMGRLAILYRRIYAPIFVAGPGFMLLSPLLKRQAQRAMDSQHQPNLVWPHMPFQPISNDMGFKTGPHIVLLGYFRRHQGWQLAP